MSELDKNRMEIEQIDKEMAKLFIQRLSVAKNIAEYKKENALPVYDKVREDALIEKNCSFIDNASYRGYYAQFIKDVMKVSKEYQEKIINGVKVAYSGTEGAFGHIASKKMFPTATITGYSDFEKAYQAVENGECDCAVLPIENSYAGDVGQVMDLMFSGSLYVNRIFELDVTHNLLGVEGADLSTIKTVISHAQALEQCEDFIRENGLKTESYSNTALAAKYVKESNDVTIGAIASTETANALGLKIIEKGVNSNKSNATRFAVFTRSKHLPLASSINENEHFILVFTVKNEAGSLAQALNIIGAHNYNMRNLRSRPMKELLWNYYFFVEAEGNINTENGRDMLRELSAICARLKLVGTYN